MCDHWKQSYEKTRRMNILSCETADSNRNLTSCAGLVVLVDSFKRLGLNELVDHFMPAPGNNRGYLPSIEFSAFILMKHDGAKCLEDIHYLHHMGLGAGSLVQSAGVVRAL